MTNTYTIQVLGNNEPNLLQRIALVFNRRRVFIKNMNAAKQNENDLYSYTMTVETTEQWAEKIAKQLEKQIDVKSVNYFVQMPGKSKKSSIIELACWA